MRQAEPISSGKESWEVMLLISLPTSILKETFSRGRMLPIRPYCSMIPINPP